jgi:hypothetical protein
VAWFLPPIHAGGCTLPTANRALTKVDIPQTCKAKHTMAFEALAREAAITDIIFVLSHCKCYACRLLASDHPVRQQEVMHD